MAATAIASLLALPAAAQALPEGYHYEMVSPPDKNDGDVGAGGFISQYYASSDGNHLGYPSLGGWGNAPSNGVTGSYAATRGEGSWSSTSLNLLMPPSFSLGSAHAQAISDDFSTALSFTTVNLETGAEPVSFAPYTYMLDVASRDAELFTVADQTGNDAYMIDNERLAGNADFSRVVYTAGADLTNDGLSPAGGNRVYRYDEGDRSLVSVLPNGDPTLGSLAPAHLRPASSDIDVAYFTGQSPNAGLFRRDITAEQTSRVNADENSGEDPPAAAATFSGGSADGDIAYFISNQRLVDDDTDATNDLYRYDHSQPAGSRLTLISVDSEPGDGEAMVQASHGVSADGETVIFTANNQLVSGETTAPGSKLYAYTDGELRYVSPSSFTSSNDRNVKLAENGETFVFISNLSTITPEPNGGQPQAYVYDVAGDTPPVCASCRPDGQPNTRPAELMQFINVGNHLVTGEGPRRVVSEEGHVFFETEERLAPEDTNGKMDVYVWQDGELDLISSGRSDDHSVFMDAAADGSTVFFMTRERLSGWDWDDRIDAYAARTGDSLPEPEAPVKPCEGDECQGPAPLPPPFEDPGTEHVDGPGNPEFADCSALEADAEAAQQKAKKLKKKAKKANKKAKKANKQAKQARQQLDNCRSN